MSGPSDKAVGLAHRMGELHRSLGGDVTALTVEAVKAAHDPALGLDRSVCLRDVVEALRDVEQRYRPGVRYGADFIEREFTEAPPG